MFTLPNESIGIQRSLALFVIAIAAAMMSNPSHANTISYSLTADTSNFYTTTEGIYTGATYNFNTYSLINAATGAGDPAIDVAVGDTINGTVHLNNSVTMSSSNPYNEIAIELQGATAEVYAVESDAFFSYYENGALVSLPAGFTTVSGSSGFFDIGEDIVGSIPSFTFDTIVFSVEINALYGLSDDGLQEIQSGSLAADAPTLVVTDYAEPSAVPEPATRWLLLLGLAGLGMLARKKVG